MTVLSVNYLSFDFPAGSSEMGFFYYRHILIDFFLILSADPCANSFCGYVLGIQYRGHGRMDCTLFSEVARALANNNGRVRHLENDLVQFIYRRPIRIWRFCEETAPFLLWETWVFISDSENINLGVCRDRSNRTSSELSWSTWSAAMLRGWQVLVLLINCRARAHAANRIKGSKINA